MRKMIRQNSPYSLKFSTNIGILLSLDKGKKNQKDFLIKNETKIHQIV